MIKILKKAIWITIIASTFAVSSTQSFAASNEEMNSSFGDEYFTQHLDELTFHNLFPKPLYKKSYFGAAAITASVVVAGTVSYFTAGAGAPAAATGVSTIASAVGGGGAGSYMAGLSAIGSAFGGNAMLGAAILNGISIGTIGTGGSALAVKVATASSASLIGVGFLPGKASEPGKYVFDLRIPEKEMGSKSVRDLNDALTTTQDDLGDLLNDSDPKKADIDALLEKRQGYYDKAVNLLQGELKKPSISQVLSFNAVKAQNFLQKSYLYQSPENLIILSDIAYRAGKYDLFQKGIQATRKNLTPFKERLNDGYLDYLEGVAELLKNEPNIELAKNKFKSSWNKEPYTLEPVVALITIAGDNAKNDRIVLADIASMTDKAKDSFDSDKYVPRVNETGLEFNTASIYLKAEDYSLALKYFKESEDSMGFIARHMPTEGATDMLNNIRIMQAVCLFHLKKEDKAVELFNGIMKDYEDSPEKAKRFKAIYQNT